jgi:hypothetical protein
MNWIAYAVLILVTAQVLPCQSRSKPQASTSNVSTTRKTEARRVLREAKAAALKIKGDFKRRFVLDEIGAALAMAGDLEAAIDIVNRASPFSSATLDQVGQELAATNDLSRATSLGLQLKEGGSSAIISSMARSQAKSGKLDEALRTAQQIQFLEVRSYALEDIALQQAVKGNYSGARKTFALARRVHEKGLVTEDDLDMVIVTSQLSPENAKATRKTIDSWQELDKRYAALIGGAELLWQKGHKASAIDWLEEVLRELSVCGDCEFFRYLAIPLLVKLGQQDRAMGVAGALSPELRAKAYSAIAVTSAETKDVVTVNAALDRLRSLAVAKSSASGTSEFGVSLMTLHITAALIDNGLLDEASRLLTALERDPDVVSKISIEPQTQLQRVFLLAQQDRLDAARSLALKIPVGSVDETQRGKALRVTSLTQTRKNGTNSTHQWASTLKNMEDRAYALLGIAESLLEIDNVKLRYTAVQFH